MGFPVFPGFLHGLLLGQDDERRYRCKARRSAAQLTVTSEHRNEETNAGPAGHGSGRQGSKAEAEAEADQCLSKAFG